MMLSMQCALNLHVVHSGSLWTTRHVWYEFSDQQCLARVTWRIHVITRVLEDFKNGVHGEDK